MIIKNIVSYLVLTICFLSNIVNASPSVKDKMLADINFMANTFDSVYAPADWKKQKLDWDLQAELEKARNKILSSETINLKDYQLIVKDLLKSTQDYHVNVIFYRTKSATLPFTIKSAEDRYFIVDIDKSNNSSKQVTFKIGDEIIEFGGKPIKEAVADLNKQISDSNNATDQALAELLLTQRHASMVVNVPEGQVKIKILPKNSKKPKEHMLNWQKTDEKFVDNYQSTLNNKFKQLLAKSHIENTTEVNIHKIKSELLSKFNILKTRMTAHNGITDIKLNKFSIGNESSFIPELGQILWRAETGPQAYIYKNADGKKIGFLRIADYMTIDLDELKLIIEKFNRETDGLIIDQNNNPGGSVIELYEILTLLTDKPLVLPDHEYSLVQQDVAEAFQLLEYMDELEIIVNLTDGANENEDLNIAGLTIKEFINAIKNYCNFIINEWSVGKNLTGSYPLLGINEIKPNKIAYKKPITILINSLDFSCADFMPAVIQDNNLNHIKIIGTTTAGAGGMVKAVMYPNSFGVMGYSYTASIATRKNNMKIEGSGVTPNEFLRFTANDLQNNFKDYIKAINDSMNILLKESEKRCQE